MKARLLFLIFLVALLATNVVFGETFNVTSPEEFQSALTIAESNGEDDVINVAAGIYNITSTLTYSTNNGDSGHTLTIQGAGADKRFFRVNEAIILDFSIFYFIKCQDEKLKAFYLHIFDNNFNALSYPGPIREYNQCTY